MCVDIKAMAVVFGVVFVVAGVLGFVPAVVTDGNLLGLFMVDGVHNTIHLLTGVVAFVVAVKTVYAKLYFQVFGVIYAVVAVVGFITGGDLWMMHVNTADNFLHLVVAAVALWVGFYNCKSA